MGATRKSLPQGASDVVTPLPMGGDALRLGKVTASLAESNGSLPPGGWL